MNKFEQLIEYVINDEEAKARELFHEIVVEKSRSIYEELMQEEEVEEAQELDEESTHDEDEKAEKAGKKVTKDIEYDDKKDRMDEDEEIDEADDAMGRMDQYDEALGGDQQDDLIDDIEADEEGISMEGEQDDDADMSGDEDLEDRVVDLEDKLDELMAEFESLMAGDSDEEIDTEIDMDTDAGFDSEEEMDDAEIETEGLEEAISLKAAPAPVKSEEGSVNKKSTVAANAGAKGAVAKPVMSDGTDEKGRPAPTAKDLGVTPTQDAGKGAFKSAAPKAQTSQAAGVNTKSPY